MFNKKYFVLTAILLVGVVLLSGCMGGETDIFNDNDISDLENEAVIQTAFNELEKQNFNEAEKYFAEDFELQSYSDEPETLDNFLSFFEDGVYEDEYMKEEYSITNIEISELIQTSSSATEKAFKAVLIIEETVNYTYFEDNTEEKEVYEDVEEMIITINNNNKITAIKEIYPEEELKMLESLVQEIESENKVAFESYFAENVSILDYSETETYEFTGTTELYNFISDNFQTNSIGFHYYYYETINSNNVLINFEIELYDNNGNLKTIDIDSTIEYNSGDLKITSLEIYNIW